MQLEMKDGFCEISMEEMQDIDGGSPVGDAIALVTFLGGCFVAGFNAGRQLVRDVKEWWNGPEVEPIIVVGEPIS